MATFSERIRLIIESDGTSKVKGEFDEVGRKMEASGQKVEGIKGKVGQTSTFIKQNLGPALLGAGAAVGAFAIQAVGDFQDVALEAGKLADATGLSVDEASRWIEVAGDIGVNAKDLETSFGKLGKEIGANPAKFEELGLAVRNADTGAIDMNATILKTIDHLNGMRDPAEKAALAQQLLGRSWQNLSELIGMGATEISDSLAEVSDAKVINESELKRARDFRATMDTLNDTVQDLTLTFGQFIVEGLGPTIKEVATLVSTVNGLIASLPGGGGGIASLLDVAPIIGGVDNLNVALDGSADNIDRVKAAAGTVIPVLDAIPFFQVETSAEKAAKASQKHAEYLKEQGKWAAQARDHLSVYDEKAEDAAKANEKLQIATQRAMEASRLHTEELKKEAEALLEMNEGARSLADINVDLVEDIEAQRIAIEEATKTVDDAKTAVDEKAEADRKALKASIEVSDGLVAQAEAQAKAAGVTVDSTKKLDIWNKSMLGAAAQAQGPLRGAILSYIGTVNGIPAHKLTEIQAAIDRGDLATAERLLNEASRARHSAITADANTTEAERKLNHTARNRQMTIVANVRQSGQLVIGRGEAVARAEGGPLGAGQLAVVGERGKELFIPETDGFVLNARDTARVLAQNAGLGSIGGGSGAVVIHNHITSADPRAVVDAIDRYVRANGQRRLKALVA